MTEPSVTYPKPEYHYYRAPYSILSFIAGLYLDKYWSDEEFKKWVAAGESGGRYLYTLYLYYYSTMPSVVQELISQGVPEDTRNKADADGRRAPNPGNCEVLWPFLVTELSQPLEAPSGGRLPLFYDQKPVLSTVAAIYLGDDISVKQAFAYWDRAGDTQMKAKLSALLAAKGTSAAAAALQPLQQAIFQDLVDPPNCW